MRMAQSVQREVASASLVGHNSQRNADKLASGSIAARGESGLKTNLFPTSDNVSYVRLEVRKCRGFRSFWKFRLPVLARTCPPLRVAPLRRFLDRCGVLTNGGRANAEMDCVG